MAQDTEPKKRANSIYTHVVQDGQHVWDFGPVGRFEVQPEKISASARHFLLNYGLTQWVNDGAAVSAGPDGKVNPTAKFNGARERAELLNVGTEASGLLRRGAGSGVFSYVTRALMRLGTYSGVDVSTADAANAFIKRLAESTDEKVAKYKFGGQVKKVRDWLEANSPKIRDAIEAIKAEETAPVGGVDADELLGDLGGD